jgi:uncharacterized membrane protein YjjP (DUF1212 family)
LLLVGVVTLNKLYLRPHAGSSVLALIVTGSVPNFAAAFFVSLCAVSPVLVVRPRFGRLLVYLAALAAFTLLTLEEMIGIVGASRAPDSFDVLASAAGAILACLSFELLVKAAETRVKKSNREPNANDDRVGMS